MNSEIEIPKIQDSTAIPIPIENLNLAEFYNTDFVDQYNNGLVEKYKDSKSIGYISKKSISYRDLFGGEIIDFSIYAKGSILTASTMASTIGFLANYSPFANYSPLTVVITSITAFSVGCFVGMPLTYQAYKLYDNSRLKKYAKSSNHKKRNYYINRVLYGLLAQRAADAEIFNNRFLLGYSLWLYERGRELRASGKRREFRNLFKKVTLDDFIRDSEMVESYINLAKDMNDGEFDRGYIPFAAYNQRQYRMFKKYGQIIAARKYSGNGEYQTDIEKEKEQESKNEFKWKTERENQAKRDKKEENDKKHERQMLEEKYQLKDQLDAASKLFSGGVQEQKLNTSVAEEPLLNNSIGSTSQKFDNDMIILRDITSEWIATQSDIVQLLKYPLLSDMNEPLVKEFHTRLSFAKSLSMKTLDNDFVLAVSNLSTAWDSLIHEAQRVELSKFDKDERKKILVATNLMNIALNSASTPAERQSAYKKAMEQLKGLVVIPKRAMESIEKAVSYAELLA